MNVKQLLAVGLIALTALLVSGSGSFAATFGESWDADDPKMDPYCPPNSDCSLQSLLDYITVSGPGIDTVTDQTGYQLFQNTATSNSTASFMFEIAGFASKNQFGIYNVSNPLEKVEVFDGANYSGAASTIYFTDSAIVVWTGQLDPDTGDLVTPPPPTFTEYDYNWNKFGFYLKRDNTTFYTQTSLNDGGYEQAVVYQGDNQTVLDLPGRKSGRFMDNEYIIAFENMWLGGRTDRDYNDLVVMVESIEPFPEPRAIAGLAIVGASLGVLGCHPKRKVF